MSIDSTHVSAAFDERLSLNTPVLLSEESLRGHALRSVQHMNRILLEVFARTETPLPKLIAQVRTNLGLPRKPFAALVGLSCNGYTPAESDRGEHTQAHHNRYTKTLDAWRNKGIAEGIREQCLELLENNATLNSFYRRMGFDLGREEVERRIPSIWSTIDQRTRRPEGMPPTVPSYLEVLRHIDVLYPRKTSHAGPDMVANERRRRRLLQAEDIWSREQTSTLLARRLEEPLVRVLVALERDLASRQRTTLTAKVLTEHCGLTPKQAYRLQQCELLPWEVIEPVIRDLFRKGSDLQTLRVAWEQAWREERERPSFSRACAESIKGSGLHMGDIARLLDVKPPEDRSKGYKAPKRSQRYRPDNLVRGVIHENANCAQVPVAALIAVVAQNDADRAALTSAYEGERKRYYRRTGSWLSGEGLDVRILRELAGEGTTMRGVVERLLPARSSKAQIREECKKFLRLEHQQQKSRDTATFGDMRQVLQRITDEKVSAALERLAHWKNIAKAPIAAQTIQEMTSSFVRIMKGANHVSAVMRENAPEDSLCIPDTLIGAMMRGEYVPPLPVLGHMADSVAKQRLPEEVENDWYDSFPRYLRDRPRLPMRHPLARVLTTMIARIEARCQRRFFETRYVAGTPSVPSKALYQLQRNSVLPRRKEVEATVIAAGYEKESIPHALALGLLEHQTIPQTLRSLRALLASSGEEMSPRVLIGLTSDELAHIHPTTGT